jgi:carbonic anhydrase/acetyltransferase-like protein (isoleucine patch superfamily)
VDVIMTISSFESLTPRIGARVFVAPTATVIGDVELSDDVSVWFNVVLRGDIHWIRVGARSNLQDGVVVHVENGLFPTVLEEEVSVGHGAVLHGCAIGGGTLVGMGALILNDAVIGEESVVAAGAVVKEGFRAPSGTLVAGVPAVVKRSLDADERRHAREIAHRYLGYKERYLAAGVGAEPGAKRGPA